MTKSTCLAECQEPLYNVDPMTHVIVVDDEPAICWSLQQLFEAEGFRVSTFSSVEDSLQRISHDPANAIVLDVRLPGMNGLDGIRRFQEIQPEVPIILITAFGDLSTAVEAYQAHVAEYLTKPFDLEQVLQAVRHALDRVASRSPTTHHSPPSATPPLLVGRSAPMQDIFKRIALAAQGDVPVLITGESGTGKELVAAAIHRHSARAQQPYIPVTLPALSENLIESELFGHARGAFTGANDHRDGLFAMASGGTILLDEIADLPAAQQVKLLRVLEQGEYMPVGDVRPRRCDVRILAATHQDLPSKIATQSFRQDLYFRLAVFPIHVPPLRDRLEDLPLLCQAILQRIHYRDPSNALDQATLEELRLRSWPGNVRELRNTLEHAALMARGQRIQLHHLPAESTLHDPPSPNLSLTQLITHWVQNQLRIHSEKELAQQGLFERFLLEVEPPLLREIMNACGGNKVAAATSLGIHRATLREKLKKYELDS